MTTNAQKRAWQKRNPEVVKFHTNKWRQKQQAIIDAARNKPCMDCGGVFPLCCMEFDHLPGSEKVKEVSHMRYRRTEIIEAEIAKCDVVCANCHKIRTVKRLHQGESKDA